MPQFIESDDTQKNYLVTGVNRGKYSVTERAVERKMLEVSLRTHINNPVNSVHSPSNGQRGGPVAATRERNPLCGTRRLTEHRRRRVSLSGIRGKENDCSTGLQEGGGTWRWRVELLETSSSG